MKKLIQGIAASVSLVAVLTLVALSSTETTAEAQPIVCNRCCDINPYTGGLRPKCVLVEPAYCGSTCECFGLAGFGTSC